MTDKLNDDDYVANLLKQDARKAAKTYELVGIDAFNPRRAKSGAPKPNTSFLRNIIRQTDSHNAALLAKEAEDSNARLQSMNREKQMARHKERIQKQNEADGRLTLVLDDEVARPVPSKSGRREHGSDSRHRRKDRDDFDTRHNRCHEEVPCHKRRQEYSEADQSTRKRRRSRSPHGKEPRNRHREDDERQRSRRIERPDRNRRRRLYSRSTSRSRSPSRTPHSHRHRRRHKSGERSHSIHKVSDNLNPTQASLLPRENVHRSLRRSASPASDSDPLEAIVGPLPPSAQPSVRSRGRGAHKANAMGIDSRFSSTYNPSVDVRPDSDVEDDWDDALELLKDRQRWQQQGADRLKAAGFSDQQIKKWEKGEEQTEEDVVWSRKGQAREWDRGKVVNEDGYVELKADFGRLN